MASIRDVMSGQIVSVEPTTTVAEAATVMGSRGVGSALVLDGGDLRGIFTERDILRALAADFDAAGHPVSHWMTPDPVTTEAGSDPGDALDLMLAKGFRHLPVVDDGRLIGVVSLRDLGKHAAS
jgi:CBS domain-containing protein